MNKLIQGGNIHNAIVPEPFVADILIENGKIAELAKKYGFENVLKVSESFE